jgi:hypothetical protein
MQPDATKNDLSKLVDLVNKIEFDSKTILMHIQEADYLIGESRYQEADVEILKALEVLRGLNG